MSSSHCTVLIVENCLLDQELYRRCLLADSSCCYSLLSATSASDALELCRTRSIDAVLLDYGLPDANGLEFLRALQAQSQGNQPPVVMVAGQGDETIAVQAMKLGAEDYLAKQRLNPERLQLAVRSAIENARLRLRLRQSEEQFRISVENLLDCFGICTAIRSETGEILDLRIDYLNAAALQSNSMTAADIGRGLCEVFPAHRDTGLFDEYCRVIQTGEPLTKEELIYADQFGSRCLSRAFDIRASKLNDGIVLAWRDVTARKQAESDRQQTEQRLRQSEEQLQIGVQVAGVAIAHFDYASNRVTLTPEAAAMFGLPLHELSVTRERIHATFHPEERDDLMEIIRQVLDPAGKGWFSREHRVVWQSGQVRWLNVRKQVFFDRSGAVPRPDYAILAAVDITDRKQAEATVQAQLAQIEAIYATAPIGLCFIDRDRRFVQMNERLAEINGLPVSAQIGRTVREVLPELAEVQEPIFAQVLQTGKPVLDVEIQGATPAQPGVNRYWLVSYYPLIAADEQILGVNIMVQEITERKQAETERNRLLTEAQSARAAAEAANRSKDEFVALVAHELRSPLNAILGWAKLLQMQQLDAATTMRALETIDRNTRAQVQLVEDLLDVSRIVRGTLQLTIEPVNLVQVVEEAIETVRPMAAAKPLHLETRLQPVAPTLGDFNRLRQVVLNLLTNAIKFTPANGRIEISLEPLPDRACIRVRDTGRGIKPDFLPQIFDRFSQDQQNPASKQGLGLGLAIVKHLVESHSGTVTVESPGEGQGAAFTVLLPLGQEDREDGEDGGTRRWGDGESCSSSAAAAPLADVRILLVDDEADMLDLTTFLLEQYGAIVQTATSAAAALEQLQQFQPDVLLSDIAMPQQDGYELLRQVQSRYPEMNLPAIALTAYASQSRYEESLRAGFQQHLTKPVEPEALVQAILSAMSWRKPDV